MTMNAPDRARPFAFLEGRSYDGGLRRVAQALAVAVALLAAPQLAHAQQDVVAGTVRVGGSERLLPGAQITIDGQPGRAAVSDASGKFRITGVTGTQVTMNARIIGYRPETKTVRVGATDVQFTMTERVLELDQMVVTGTAGGAEKRTIGTSVASVPVSDVMAKTTVPSVEGLLNGRTPGLIVLPTTGQAGAGAQVRVRGIGTFSLSSNPLLYVDGVRVNNGSDGIVTRLNDFDPEEIENIEVLKGPAAATLYGTEAARGVINIITKKGTAGSTKYAFTVKDGTNWFMDAENRIPYNYCSAATAASACRLSPTDSASGTIYSVNVVKTEAQRGTPLFRDGGVHNYGANVSGGTSLFRFFASGEFNAQQGIDYANERVQQNARSNLSVTPNDKFDLSASVGYIKSHTSTSCEGTCGGSLWGSEYSNPAKLPMFCTASSARGCGWGRGFNSFSPEAYRANQNWQDLNRFTGSVTAKYSPFTWLSHRLTIGTDYTQQWDVSYTPYITNDTIAFFYGTGFDGSRSEGLASTFFNTYDYSGSANFNVKPNLLSKTSFGVQYYTNYSTSLNASGTHFPTPGLSTITATSTKGSPSSNSARNNTFGFYGQQEAAWNDRLFLTGAVRVDNNSSFGSEVSWVTYPKLSIAYVVSDEPKIRDHLPGFIDNLRFRAAYGASGQQPGVNTALRTLSPVAGPNGLTVLTTGTFGNPDLRPERVLGSEGGFEAALFRERLGIDLTYFRDISHDAILSKGVAPSVGFGSSSQLINAGEITKSGVEVSLKGQVINRRTVGWDMNFVVGTNNAKINKLSGAPGDTNVDLGNQAHRIGYSPYSWFSYRVLSATFDPVTRKAIKPICDDGKGGSMNCFAGDNSLTNALIAPKVYLGRFIPRVEGSFTNSLRVGPFTARGMMDYATSYRRTDNNLRIRCQLFLTCLEYLQPDKTDPRELVQMQTGGTLRDFVITDAKYLKLRELSLTYDAPDRIAGRLNAHALSLNISARNLHTWTPYKALDPENQLGGTGGVDQAEYPQLAVFIMTLHLAY